MREIKVAWWKDVPNFGDILTPVLLERLGGIKPIYSTSDKAEFFGVGSYLEALPKGYTGYVWGTGKMFEESKIDLSTMKILALRGLLSYKNSDCECEIFGDPGLLVKFIAPIDIVKKQKVGIIAHWNDKKLVKKYPKDRAIDITSGVDEVIKEAAACEKIISSSLHGIILADALGIPRMWEPSDNNPGKGFKFRDYQSIYGDTIEPAVWYEADRSVVLDTCIKLTSVLLKV